MISKRLFHFSDRGGVARFEPRPVEIPSLRPPGREWLNGPLVWAIEEAREPLYLFPRDCPRILVWATDESLEVDRARWLGKAAFAAYVERNWIDRLGESCIWRYRLPPETFEDLGDAGMWVSRTAVAPVEEIWLADFPAELAARGVDLRVVDRLVPFEPLWQSSLHVSAVRLRNAGGR